MTKQIITSAIDIEQRIYLLRGMKVMLSGDLAALYGVSHKVMLQSVKRNNERFPDEFMFLLTPEESASLRSQFVTLDAGRGKYSKYRPYAFTEQGVAMLSGILRSGRAIQVNIAIMRTFVKLRQLLSANKELAEQLSQLERKVEKHDHEIHAIFEAIRQLMRTPEKPKRPIGFKVGETKARYIAHARRSKTH